MTNPILAVTVQPGPSDPVTVLVATGEIDHDSRGILEAAAMQCLGPAGTCLIIDLSAVSFCDSGGLSLFVDLNRRIDAGGGWLRLAGAQGMVRGVLRATNLDRLFTLYDDADAAAADRAPVAR
jgi:anti-sigma B factor antagonist